MTYHALIVVIFLLNGEPVLLGSMIPEGHDCGEVEAKELASASGLNFQDDILWDCLEITSPGPVKLYRPPRQDEVVR